MTKIAYRRVAVDSIDIFYREGGRSVERSCTPFCGTAFQLEATCSAISCRSSPTDFT
jgi:hypothetical protein